MIPKRILIFSALFMILSSCLSYVAKESSGKKPDLNYSYLYGHFTKSENSDFQFDVAFILKNKESKDEHRIVFKKEGDNFYLIKLPEGKYNFVRVEYLSSASLFRKTKAGEKKLFPKHYFKLNKATVYYIGDWYAEMVFRGKQKYWKLSEAQWNYYRATSTLLKDYPKFRKIQKQSFYDFATGGSSAKTQSVLKKCVSIQSKKNGKESYSISLKCLDAYLREVARYAENYPPKFPSYEKKKQIKNQLISIIGLLKTLTENQKKDKSLILRLAYANALGHNLNISGASYEAKKYYEKLLSLAPNHIGANLYYGIFLAGTNQWKDQCVPYLQNAIQLGAKKGHYTLGLYYFAVGQKEKALRHLKKYSEAYPQLTRLKKLIKAIEDGTLKVRQN